MIPSHLRHAARLYGLQTSYKNVTGETIWAKPARVTKLLSALTNHPVQTDKDLQSLIHRRHCEWREQGWPFVHVMWEGRPKTLAIWLSENDSVATCQVTVKLEDGNELVLAIKLRHDRRTRYFLDIPSHLPLGYHRLLLQTSKKNYETLLIIAPNTLISPAELEHSWGAFAPLYALRSKKDWGVASLKDLENLNSNLKPFGCQWLGQLPLLPGRFETPDCDPSPYSSLSRLFWNEIYLDCEELVAESGSTRAQQLISSPEFQSRLTSLRNREYVDFYEVYNNKKQVWRILAQEFFSSGQDQSQEFLQYKILYPELPAYSQFRSPDTEEQRLHQYVQYQMQQQLERLTGEKKISLYMDFPIGVNDGGFDAAHFRDIFFREASVGAPPEPVFALGQDWGFSPFHPTKLQKSGYVYFRKALAHHLRFSKILRLDHVIGLYRIYAIAKGQPATEGVFLRFPPEDLFAICCLEAHRAGADIIGENLGTVPEAVNETLKVHQFKGMNVAQFELEGQPATWEQRFPKETLLCINNHDMPMFHAFCSGEDLKQVADLKILSADLAKKFWQERQQILGRWQNYLQTQDPAELYKCWLEKLSKCQSRYFIINPEDFWGELRPQNIPGTYREVPNWRRRFTVALEDFTSHPTMLPLLKILQRHRGK